MASTHTLLPADLGGVGSGSWQSIVRDVIAVGVTLWAATVLWVVIDARRRLVSLPGQAAAACLAVFLPFFGALLYRIVRPADLHAETRIRELEHELLLSELSGRRVCAHCAAPIAPDFVACPVCGTQLRHRCEACGGVLELRWTLCPYCGDARVEADEVGRATANGNGGSRTRRRSRRRIRA